MGLAFVGFYCFLKAINACFYLIKRLLNFPFWIYLTLFPLIYSILSRFFLCFNGELLEFIGKRVVVKCALCCWSIFVNIFEILHYTSFAQRFFHIPSLKTIIFLRGVSLIFLNIEAVVDFIHLLFNYYYNFLGLCNDSIKLCNFSLYKLADGLFIFFCQTWYLF